MQATINSITPRSDGTGQGVNLLVNVTFSDATTGYSYTKDYTFPVNVSLATARSAIVTDGTLIKNQLATIGTLQQYVGTVITL